MRLLGDDIPYALIEDFTIVGVVKSAASVSLDHAEDGRLLILMRPHDGRVSFGMVGAREDVDMGIEVHVFKDFVVDFKIGDALGNGVFAFDEVNIDVGRMQIGWLSFV